VEIDLSIPDTRKAPLYGPPPAPEECRAGAGVGDYFNSVLRMMKRRASEASLLLYLQCRNETSPMVSASSPTAAAKVSTPTGPPLNLLMIALRMNRAILSGIVL
jgi:hypothetical protein